MSDMERSANEVSLRTSLVRFNADGTATVRVDASWVMPGVWESDGPRITVRSIANRRGSELQETHFVIRNDRLRRSGGVSRKVRSAESVSLASPVAESGTAMRSTASSPRTRVATGSWLVATDRGRSAFAGKRTTSTYAVLKREVAGKTKFTR